MSLPRKGSRAITVDGARYRWVAVYAGVTWCSAACPLRLTVRQEGGRGGQLLVAGFSQSTGKDEAGREWVFPRYRAEATPGVVADVIHASRAGGWEPDKGGRPPCELDGEPFLRVPPDPTQPPPGSEDDRKRWFLSALREQILASLPAPPAADPVPPGEKPGPSPDPPDG